MRLVVVVILVRFFNVLPVEENDLEENDLCLSKSLLLFVRVGAARKVKERPPRVRQAFRAMAQLVTGSQARHQGLYGWARALVVRLREERRRWPPATCRGEHSQVVLRALAPSKLPRFFLASVRDITKRRTTPARFHVLQKCMHFQWVLLPIFVIRPTTLSDEIHIHKSY